MLCKMRLGIQPPWLLQVLFGMILDKQISSNLHIIIMCLDITSSLYIIQFRIMSQHVLVDGLHDFIIGSSNELGSEKHLCNNTDLSY